MCLSSLVYLICLFYTSTHGFNFLLAEFLLDMTSIYEKILLPLSVLCLSTMSHNKYTLLKKTRL